jgi:membrane protein required for colicin V production
MNLLDIILIIPLIWFAYRGFSRGLIIELASLAALILGIYASIHFSWYAAEFLAENFDLGEKYLPIISLIVTFVVVVLIVYAVGKIVEKLVDIVALGFLNKMFGMAFGILKAALFLSVVLLIINAFDDDNNLISQKQKDQSMLYQPIAGIVPWLIPWFESSDFNWERDVDEGILKKI